MERRIDGPAGEPGDTWATRLAKLIPGEALALYGAGTALVPDSEVRGLWFLALVCLAFTCALRWKATQSQGRGPQVWAVVIAAISFALWVAALDRPAGPIDWDDDTVWIPGLLALLWATIVPVFYTGDNQT